MARSRKEPRYLDDVLIERMGAEGQCVAHIEEKVLFVPYAAPGDRCRIRVGRSKRSYMTGTIEAVSYTHLDVYKRQASTQHAQCGGGATAAHLELYRL